MRKIKVLQPSDYSFDRIIEAKAQGKEAFIVSLFGYEYLSQEKELDITVIYPDRNKRITKILTKLFKLEGRNFLLQLKTIKLSSKFDVVYYATDRHPYLIALARLFGFCKCPILMVSHFTYNPRTVKSIVKRLILRIERFFVYRGIDRIVFASQNVLDLAKEKCKIPKRHWTNAGWGADLDYFSKEEKFKKPFEDYYFAAGSANRDYHTLIEAFRQMPDKYLIISISPANLKNEYPLPENVKVFDYTKYGIDVYVHLRDLYQDSLAVLIPVMKENHVPNGASVLVEALACGKAIFATDLPSNFIEIEKERIGKVAQIHDAKDWIRIINDTTYYDLKCMGEKARMIAETRYNYKLFANNIIKYIKEIV